MIYCEWCDAPLKAKYKRHLLTCFMKLEGITMKQKYTQILLNEDPQHIHNSEHELQSLKDKLSELEAKLNFLKEENLRFRGIIDKVVCSVNDYKMEEHAPLPYQIIEERSLAISTVSDYRNTLKRYFEFTGQDQNKPLSIHYVTSYIKHLIKDNYVNNRSDTSTIIKVRAHLTSLLRTTYPSLSITLPKIKKIILKKKFTMEQKHYKEWIAENKGTPIGIMSIMMAHYGLRINSLLSFKKENIDDDFLYLRIQDSKTQSDLSRRIPKILRKLLARQVRNLKQEDYVFFPKVTNRRSIIVKFNKLLKKSNAFPRDPNYRYSSHIFRRYAAKCAKQGIKRAQNLLGHTNQRVTEQHYLN